jgi:uncharacterized membrane protein (UPF0127 family)
MPVLVEMTSIVGPAGILRRPLAAAGHSPVDDGELVAVPFRGNGPMREALRQLELEGHSPWRDAEPGQVALVDQVQGPGLWWPWLELAVVEVPGAGRILAARRAGDTRHEVSLPQGWSYPRSASARHGVGDLSMPDRPLRHVRREEAFDLYADRWTGEEVRLRREHARVRVGVRAPGSGGGEVGAELVSRWEEIEVGLMFRNAIEPDEGMLFRFDGPRLHAFWIKNTLVPLDILFLDGAGRVVNIAERAAPLRTSKHRSAGPVLEVLEVPGGWCAAHGIGAGARVTVLDPELPPRPSP